MTQNNRSNGQARRSRTRRNSSTSAASSPMARKSRMPGSSSMSRTAGTSRPAKASRMSRAAKASPQAKVHAASSVASRTPHNGVSVTLPGKGPVMLTRRHFLYGAAGVAAIAVLGAGYTFTKTSTADAGNLSTLKVPGDAVFTTDDCTTIEDETTVVSEMSAIEMPFGTMVWSSSDDVAVCLIPTDEAAPLSQVGIISMGSAVCTTIINHPIGEDEGFEIYDVRANENGIIWVEADILDGTWRVYHAALDDLTMGDAVLAAQGNSEWEMPTLAVADNYGFWQMLPQLDGPHIQEDSVLMRAPFGENNSEVAYSSHGRMACSPTSDGDGIIIAPRVNTDGTYYQLTRLDGASAEVTDALILPTSMKPFEVSYGKTGFIFSFDGIYNYGDGIANLGTYTPATSVLDQLASADSLVAQSSSSTSSQSTSGEENSQENAQSEEDLALRNERLAATLARFNGDVYSQAEWFRFPNTPSAPASWLDNWLMVKAGSGMFNAVYGINLENRENLSLPLENGSSDYGDYLASTGARSRVITYANIDYEPMDGDAKKYCLVRLWETL